MVHPGMPAYSAYPGGKTLEIGQPGLATALGVYDPQEKRFAVAESTCFGCASKQHWMEYFNAIFNCPYGNAQYVRIYNMQPFLASAGALDALAALTGNKPPASSCYSVDDSGGCWCPVPVCTRSHDWV
jgi:hypothetical protein